MVNRSGFQNAVAPSTERKPRNTLPVPDIQPVPKPLSSVSLNRRASARSTREGVGRSSAGGVAWVKGVGSCGLL